MKSAIFTALFFLAAALASANIENLESRINCPQASRFGDLTITPNGTNAIFNPGDTINIHVDFTCGITNFNIVPVFLDYNIEVPAALNNGFEAPTVLAHGRQLKAGSLSDSFTTKIPHTFFFKGGAYEIVFTNTYSINGTDGSQVLIQGGLSQGININGTL